MHCTVGLSNSTALMKSWSNRPSTTEGRKATIRLSANRRDAGSPGRVTTARHSLVKYSTTTARMAPNWIITAKVSQKPSGRPIAVLASSIMPVDETGMNSVNPSMTPRMTA